MLNLNLMEVIIGVVIIRFKKWWNLSKLIYRLITGDAANLIII